jgi:hypothetical protein
MVEEIEAALMTLSEEAALSGTRGALRLKLRGVRGRAVHAG